MNRCGRAGWITEARMHFYNEFDAGAAAWLRELMADGLIPKGVVDERSITEVRPEDLEGFVQCHFFAGLGGWSLALQMAEWPETKPVWTGSCPCFPAGTLVMTANGYKPIEAVAVGDMVLSHRARFRRVEAVGSEVADCVIIKGQGHSGLVCTPNHPFLVGDDEWCEAAEMKGRRWATVAEVPPVVMPMPQPKNAGCFFDKHLGKYRARGELNGKSVHIGVFDTLEDGLAARQVAVAEGRVTVRGADAVDVRSNGFARFLGYWIGDGWVSGGTVLLCGSRDDAGLLSQLFADAGMPGKPHMERTSSRIRCGSKSLVKWLRENFGEFAHGKRIPVWLYGMPEAYRRAFLDGYMLADGHEETQSNGVGTLRVFTTASKGLAVGVRVLLNQLGSSASIRVSVKNRQQVIEGRSVSEAPSYKVIAYETARSFRLSGRHGWGLVRSVKPAGTHTVYNLAVEEDESYTADGIVVHNCQPYSAAGKQLGNADERNLWPEFARLIRECRPQCVFGEQVESAIRHGWLDGVSADLEAEGYAVGSCVLGAHSVGSPHIRQRLFWVADTGDRGLQPGGEHGQQPQDGGVGERVGDSDGGRLGQGDAVPRRTAAGSGVPSTPHGLVYPGRTATSGVDWSDSRIIVCRNGKARRIPTQPSLFPLAHGVSGRVAVVRPGVEGEPAIQAEGDVRHVSRVAALRGAGNAIVPEAAAAFIQAYLEVI